GRDVPDPLFHGQPHPAGGEVDDDVRRLRQDGLGDGLVVGGGNRGGTVGFAGVDVDHGGAGVPGSTDFLRVLLGRVGDAGTLLLVGNRARDGARHDASIGLG